jgi:ribonucleoside-diphosphate reductase beta chain
MPAEPLSVTSLLSEKLEKSDRSPQYILKRDGTSKQSFDDKKIYRAVRGAWIECFPDQAESIQTQMDVWATVQQVTQSLRGRSDVTVEQVQDAVELSLMRSHRFEVAKAFIVFRQNRASDRKVAERWKQIKASRTDAPATCNMLSTRPTYRPFEYPKYFEYFKKQNQAHWLPLEVPMENDIIDFKKNLSDSEKSLITNILRFFTQSDIEVNNNYNSRLIPVFPKPEIRMMLSSFAAMECVHVWAYSYLNDSLGLPDKEYSAFLNYQEMRDKYDYIRSFDIRSVEDLAINLAVFGGFIEGVSLFSSFAILMNFPRMGKMKGVGQIVSWSIRDESLHSEAICSLFRDLVSENRSLWTNEFQGILLSACRDMVTLEDAFIDCAFAGGDVPGLKKEEVKQYIRFIADKRLAALGLDPIFGVSNPLKWLDTMVNAKEHANFFESRATEYAKGGILDDWE